MKIILFIPPPHYKIIWWNRERDKQYWKEIAAEFIKQKHNSDTSQQEFPIELYLGKLLYKPFFIVLTLWGELVIGLTKKLVASYVVGDLTFLD